VIIHLFIVKSSERTLVKDVMNYQWLHTSSSGESEKEILSHLSLANENFSSNDPKVSKGNDSQQQNVNESKVESEPRHKEGNEMNVTAKGNPKCQIRPSRVTFLLPPPIVDISSSFWYLSFSFLHPPDLTFFYHSKSGEVQN